MTKIIVSTFIVKHKILEVVHLSSLMGLVLFIKREITCKEDDLDHYVGHIFFTLQEFIL